MLFSRIFVVLVVLVPLLLVALDRLRVDVAALLIAALLGLAQFLGMGVLGPPNHPHDAVVAISGFAQPVVITLLSLFIITRTLERTGVTYWIAGRVIAIGGRSERRLIFLFATVTALLSLFMNNLAAGALMLPSAISVSRRTGVSSSKLLIPVAYGSLLGGVRYLFYDGQHYRERPAHDGGPAAAPAQCACLHTYGGVDRNRRYPVYYLAGAAAAAESPAAAGTDGGTAHRQ